MPPGLDPEAIYLPLGIHHGIHTIEYLSNLKSEDSWVIDLRSAMKGGTSHRGQSGQQITPAVNVRVR